MSGLINGIGIAGSGKIKAVLAFIIIGLI